MAESLQGGCFCGALRYEAVEPFSHGVNCHCSMCRRTTGAPFVAWFSVPRSGFRLLQGQGTRFHSSAKGRRTFCPRCGTQLTFEEEGRNDEIDITTCSLDHPERLPPQRHIYTDSKLGWIKLNDGLPEISGGGEPA